MARMPGDSSPGYRAIFSKKTMPTPRPGPIARPGLTAGTGPNIMSQVVMNNKKVRDWEVRLGALQLIILIGVITGSMFSAFYLGYSSGRNVGFEAAYATSMANTVRLPISQESEKDSRSHAALVSEVYAKLNEGPANGDEGKKGPAAHKEAEHERAQAPLGSIKDAEVAPIVVEQGNGEGEVAVGNEGLADSEGSAVTVNGDQHEEITAGTGSNGDKLEMRVLGEDSKGQDPQGKTLGSLVAGQPADSAHSDSLHTAEKSSAALEEEIPVEVPPVRKEERAKVAALKAEPPAPKTKDDVPVRTNVGRGWYAQVAAPGKRDDALALSKRLRSSGFPVVIEHAQVKGVDYFRVLVGPENSKDHADRLVGQLKREPYIKAVPFIKSVK